MRKLWLLLLVVIPLYSIQAQEVHHAPTVEQCRADARVWKDDLDIPVFDELISRYGVMYDCEKVDVDVNWRMTYIALEREIFANLWARSMYFMDRHNLVNQFKIEDAAGKRR